MFGLIKWLASLGAAVAGGVIGDTLYAQRDEHPSGDVVPTLMPTQIVPCLALIAFAARATKGNPLAMLGAGLAAGLVTSLAYGSAAKVELLEEISGS